MSNRFYERMWTVFAPIFRFLYPLEVEGLENVPCDEPLVICANHSSAIDPVLLAAALPKTAKLRVMAKKQLFKIPGLGRFITKLGAFPVDRGHSDIAAVKTAIGCLKDGWHLVIFPEGTRMKNGQRGQAKGGVAMFAIRAGVKMLPVFVGIRKKLFCKVKVIFGQPYEPVYTGRRGTAEEYQANADEVMRQIYELGGVQ